MRRLRPTRYRAYSRAAPDQSSRGGLPTWAAVTIAIAGIVATLAAALVSAAINADSQRDTQKQSQEAQAKDADQKELRKVVDEAALIVIRADRAMNQHAEFLIPQTFSFGRDRGRVQERKSANAFHNRIDAMDGPQARLTIRLGDKHPLTQAFGVTRDALFNVDYCFLVAANYGLTKKKREDWASNDFEDVRRAVAVFKSEAARTVGSRLGAPARSSAPRGALTDTRRRVDKHAAICE
jgi:hypothetical protein